MATKEEKKKFFEYVKRSGFTPMSDEVLEVDGGLLVAVEHPFREGWSHGVSGRVVNGKPEIDDALL